MEISWDIDSEGTRYIIIIPRKLLLCVVFVLNSYEFIYPRNTIKGLDHPVTHGKTPKLL